MSKRLKRSLALALVLLLIPAVALGVVAAQGYTLPWRAAGGEVLRGSSYTLLGAAGVTGSAETPATGGGYSLVGGYVPPSAESESLGNGVYLPIVKGAN